MQRIAAQRITRHAENALDAITMPCDGVGAMNAPTPATIEGFSLVRTTIVRHRADVQGEVITRTDIIRTPDGLVAVDFWAEWTTGNPTRISAPRPLRSGE